MRIFFITFVLGIALLAQSAEAKCHKPEQGPAGPQGPQGIPGPEGPQGPTGSLAISYASGAGDVQAIIATILNFPIDFPTNLVSPVGIVHPYLLDDASFQIVDSGIYQISWTVPLEFDSNLEDSVELFLFDAATATYFLPSPISKGQFDNISGSITTTRFMTLSGQTVLSLPSGTVVQLHIHVTGVITGVKYARFTITKIAN